MTKLLEHAIAKARELPEAEQNELAEILLSVMARNAEPIQLDDETRAAVQEGLEQARRGEFVSDEEIEALWKSHGL